MKNAKKGLVAAVMGIVLGIGLTAAVDYLITNGLLPSYWALLFGFIGIIGNLATLKSMRRGAVFYTIGWLVGSVLLRAFLGPVDIIFNMVAPTGILALRVWLWVKRPFRKSPRGRFAPRRRRA